MYLTCLHIMLEYLVMMHVQELASACNFNVRMSKTWYSWKSMQISSVVPSEPNATTSNKHGFQNANMIMCNLIDFGKMFICKTVFSIDVNITIGKTGCEDVGWAWCKPASPTIRQTWLTTPRGRVYSLLIARDLAMHFTSNPKIGMACR